MALFSGLQHIRPQLAAGTGSKVAMAAGSFSVRNSVMGVFC